MRLATFNILHGLAPADGTVDKARLRAAVADLDADVLGLQEVDCGRSRSGNVDQAATAASAYAGDVRHRFVPTLEQTYGIALITRLPVVAWHEVLLPPSKAVPRVANGSVRWHAGEPRAMVAAVVVTTFGLMTVATTHLSTVRNRSLRQLRRVLGELQRLPAPRILLGDLNLPGRLPATATGWRSLAHVPSYPAAHPTRQIDHVLAQGPLPPLLSVESRTLPFSDHRAIVVDL